MAQGGARTENRSDAGELTGPRRRQSRLFREEIGASAVEYALLIALVALVIIAAVAFLGNRTADLFSSVSTGF